MPESVTRPAFVPEVRSASAGSLPPSVSILVVDDEESIRELLVDTLSDADYHVCTASSAEEALEKLFCIPIDLVLSDVKMPGMDGIALSRFLSQIRPDLPVVIMTGDGDRELARVAIQQGASDFLIKPFRLESIPITVENNLERRRLEIKRILTQDARIMDSTIKTWMVALKAKEPYTAQHSLNVATLANLIAKQIIREAREARLLDMAAYVHDVGKIGVPDDVLNKAGELNEEEWAIMRTHPAEGAKMVGQIEELSYVADVVRYHHERMDGNGYPDGLCGEDIPLPSRIIAVADAYECMTSNRIYRPRYSVTEALRRLHGAAGTQFDPRIVEHFICLHREGLVYKALPPLHSEDTIY